MLFTNGVDHHGAIKSNAKESYTLEIDFVNWGSHRSYEKLH